MSTEAPTPTEPAAPAQEQPKPGTEAPSAEQPKADETDWKQEARKWEERAKANRKAADELENQRKASMTEAERAVAEAEARGRAAVTTEFGKRLARTSFDALAARRNPDFDTKSALEYVDLGRFVGDDGEPDEKAIAAAVERLVPTPSSGTPSFDGGTRTTAPAGFDMNTALRKATGRA